MKFSTLVLLSSAALAHGETVAKRQLPGVPINGMGPITAAMGIGGKVSGTSSVPQVQEMKARYYPEHGSRRVKIRYGPYQVPGSGRGAIGKVMDGEGGMAWNMPDKNIRKPCEECLITYIAAGLEDPNGKDVNSDVGLWLHHMVAINKGDGLQDATCSSNPLSLPHLDVGASSRNSERFFASGNERGPIDLTLSRAKAGYQVKKGDSMSFIIELMNMNTESKNVYMTIVWEYLPKTPAGFKHAKPVWFDAGQCAFSDVHPKSDTSPYTYRYKSWNANFDGELIGLGSHLHDGGVAIDIKRAGKLLCRSEAKYGETPKYISKMEMKGSAKMGSEGGEVKHISSISSCFNGNGNLGRMTKGELWEGTGYYDYQKFPGMARTNGKQSDVMVIVIMYVAVPMGKR